ncbi:MAG: hypothetical protein FJY37_19470 [Betaproteobacteria bacterium]|nr:hypothetical protein [Betaproteobacteria bacterium]
MEADLIVQRRGRMIWVALAIATLLSGCGTDKPPGVQLVQAVRDNDADEVASLLAEGVDPNSTDGAERDARTALCHAAVFGYADMAKMLLAKGAKVDLGASESQQTPLMAAAFNENSEMVKTLLAAGAQVNAQDPAGDTPLTQAARKGNAELATLLINAGADVEVRTKEGQTPLCLARQSNFTAAMQVLEQAGSPGDC